jgi:hypothetical protein
MTFRGYSHVSAGGRSRDLRRLIQGRKGGLVMAVLSLDSDPATVREVREVVEAPSRNTSCRLKYELDALRDSVNELADKADAEGNGRIRKLQSHESPMRRIRYPG